MSPLWTPPDGEYAKAAELKKKQAACEHHLHLREGVDVEQKSDRSFAVECCRCDARAVLRQPEARFCRRPGAIVMGELVERSIR